MDYSIVENSCMSAYEATITFNENVAQYKTTDDFEISITDIYNNNCIIIDKDNYQSYGLTDTTADYQTWEEDSFINNDGVLVYFKRNNELYIKLINRCQTQTGKLIGFNTAEIRCDFKDEQNMFVKLFTQGWPRIDRSKLFIPVNDISNDTVNIGTTPDPVLPDPPAGMEHGIRQEYDFDTIVDPQEAIGMNYDYSYSPDSIIVNTKPVDVSQAVPVYCNDVSAYYTPIYDDRSFTYSPVPSASLLVDDLNGCSAKIPYRYIETVTGTYTIPVYVAGEYQYDYKTEVPYEKYRQYLNNDSFSTRIDEKNVEGERILPKYGHYQNRLCMEINSLTAETIPGTTPTVVDGLDHLIVTVDSVNPSNKVVVDGNKATVIFKIENPNEDYRNKEYLSYGLLQGTNYNYTGTMTEPTDAEWSTYESTGILYVTVSDISVTEATDKYNTGLEAYLDMDSHPAYGTDKDSIKRDTYDSAKTAWDWIALAGTLNPLVITFGKVKDKDGNEITNQTDTSCELKYDLIPGEVLVRITNPNTNYVNISTLKYELFSDNEEFIGNIKEGSLDTSNYKVLVGGALPYITFVVENLNTAGKVKVYAYIDDKDDTVSPPISKEQMKSDTEATGILTFTYVKKQDPVPGIFEWLEDYSLYSMSDLHLSNSKIIGNYNIVQGSNVFMENNSTIYGNLVTNGNISFTDTIHTIYGNIYVSPTHYASISKDVAKRKQNGSLTTDGQVISKDDIKEKTIPEHEVHTDTNASKIMLAQNAVGTIQNGVVTVTDKEGKGTSVYANGIAGGVNKLDESDHAGYIWKDVELLQYSTLHLYPGDYYFESVHISNYATIICHTTEEKGTGAVRIWCSGRFNMEDNTNIKIEGNKSIWHLMLYTNMTSESDGIVMQVSVNAEDGGSMMGTCISPHGVIELRNKGIWYGNMWAKKVVLSDSAELHRI